MRAKKPRSKRISKKRLLAIIAIGLIVVGAGIFVLHSNKKTDSSASIKNGINYDPPTEDDKKEVEQNKEELSNDQGMPSPTPNPPSSEKTARELVITYSGQYGSYIEVSGYVRGTFEDQGKCLATFTKGSLTVSKESAGFKDVNRTTCTPFSIPRSEFQESGIWELVLSYRSNTSTGNSQATSVEVK